MAYVTAGYNNNNNKMIFIKKHKIRLIYLKFTITKWTGNERNLNIKRQPIQYQKIVPTTRHLVFGNAYINKYFE